MLPLAYVITFHHNLVKNCKLMLIIMLLFCLFTVVCSWCEGCWSLPIRWWCYRIPCLQHFQEQGKERKGYHEGYCLPCVLLCQRRRLPLFSFGVWCHCKLFLSVCVNLYLFCCCLLHCGNEDHESRDVRTLEDVSLVPFLSSICT